MIYLHGFDVSCRTCIASSVKLVKARVLAVPFKSGKESVLKQNILDTIIPTEKNGNLISI